MLLAMAAIDRITSNPNVCGGQACIRGTRVPVHVVLDFLGAGDSVDDLLREYPQLERDDIHAALTYAARLTRDEPVALKSA
jgi:uncharacterized protein (DUF433 family)